MPSLPSRFAEVILTFAPLFLQQRTWDHAGMLLIGAILAPGQRTVTSLLRIMVLGVDDTIERRRGKRISAKGIYRDPVRSSKAFFVKTSGLRWLSLMLLAP